MRLFSWFITWDSGILVAAGILLAYTLLLRPHKSLATLISVYVGYLLATTWGGRVLGFFTGDRVWLNQVWIKANASHYTVTTVLMIAVTLLLSSFVKLGGRRSKYSMPETAIYAVGTLAVALVFMLSLMDNDMRQHALAASKILPFIDHWKEWIVGLPIFAVVFFGIYTADE